MPSHTRSTNKTCSAALSRKWFQQAQHLQQQHVHSTSWRFLAAPGGSWRLLGLLAAFGSSWRLLAAPGGCWLYFARYWNYFSSFYENAYVSRNPSRDVRVRGFQGMRRGWDADWDASPPATTPTGKNRDSFIEQTDGDIGDDEMRTQLQPLLTSITTELLNFRSPTRPEWRWACRYNEIRQRRLISRNLGVKNAQHEAWFAAIDPAVDGQTLSEGFMRPRSAYGNFLQDPSTVQYLAHMFREVSDMELRLSTGALAQRVRHST